MTNVNDNLNIDDEKKQKKKEYAKQYRDEHKEKIKLLKKKWYDEHKQLYCEYYIKHRDILIEKQKQRHIQTYIKKQRKNELIEKNNELQNQIIQLQKKLSDIK